MLVLTREENESIICTLEDGREIEIMVIELSGNQAHIGINADSSIGIVRDELLKADI